MKRRMSIEKLGACHNFMVGGSWNSAKGAPRIVRADLAGLIFGKTFAETLALNRDRLDLYEAAPELKRIPAEAL